MAEKKANKIVTYFGISVAFLFLFVTVGFKVKNIIYDKNPKIFLEAKKELLKKKKKLFQKKFLKKKKK